MNNKKTQKLGFLLGTFDPIHNGHIHILEMVRAYLQLDKALLVPLYDAPHKDNTVIATSDERVEMCKLACKSTALETSSLIVDHKINGYSLDLISVIKKQYPTDQLVYILGSDVFSSILKWSSLNDIISMVEFCVVLRSHDVLNEMFVIKKELEQRKATVHICEFPIKEISSSYIKSNLTNHENIKELIPPEVEAYIKKHSLYQKHFK
ncbi:MAG: nicotinate (nicotinamide) nucleotide adenylyltransferase [Clostridiales bacterium]|nr:nicotinate (nicotinamide) nucleotide adenylyltransferase [Clostridiales bacterium]